MSQLLQCLHPLLPGLMGAAVSINFVGAGMPLLHRLISVGIGTTCASYLAPGMVAWFDLQGGAVHSALQFLVGLFALAIVREMFRELDAGLLSKLRERFLGGEAK